MNHLRVLRKLRIQQQVLWTNRGMGKLISSWKVLSKLNHHSLEGVVGPQGGKMGSSKGSSSRSSHRLRGGADPLELGRMQS